MTNITPNRAGQRLGTGSVLELFEVHAANLLIESYNQAFDFLDRTTVMSVGAGKSWEFDAVGRIAPAIDHTPGNLVTVQAIQHNKVAVSLDNITHNAVFLAEFDALLNRFDLVEPYTSQIAQSLAAVSNGRIIRTMVNGSRMTTPTTPGGPVPSFAWHANMRTDPAQIEEAIYAAGSYVREQDISGAEWYADITHRMHGLLARHQIIDTVDTSGSADRAQRTVGLVGGIKVRGVNGIPTTNFTTDTFAKYNGNFTTTAGIVYNKTGVGTLKRRGLKLVTQERPENLGWLMIGSQLEGHGVIRPEVLFEMATATR